MMLCCGALAGETESRVQHCHPYNTVRLSLELAILFVRLSSTSKFVLTTFHARECVNKSTALDLSLHRKSVSRLPERGQRSLVMDTTCSATITVHRPRSRTIKGASRGSPSYLGRRAGCLTQQRDGADGINQLNKPLPLSTTSLPRVTFVVGYTAHRWSPLGHRFFRLGVA